MRWAGHVARTWERTGVYEAIQSIPDWRYKNHNLTTKRVWKLHTSTKLRATLYTDSLDMVVLPSTGASRYHNCCIDDGTSTEYFGYALVQDYGGETWGKETTWEIQALMGVWY
jgi:hypothetical protein